MFKSIKQYLKIIIVSTPYLADVYFRNLVYKFGIDSKTLKSKIQNLGHNIDISHSTGRPIPILLLKELEFLINEMRRIKLDVDEATAWAFEWYVIGKYDLKKEPLRLNNLESINNDVLLNQAIKQRRSVRKWTDVVLPQTEIEKAIELAKWAPSSCNRQTWKMMFLNKGEERKFISKYFPNNFWHEAPLLVLFLADSDLYGDNEKHFVYLDGAAFIQNFLLILHSMGYGACWLGFKGWDSRNNIFVENQKRADFYRYFNLKDALVPVSMIAIGYPAIIPNAPPRQALDNILIKRE